MEKKVFRSRISVLLMVFILAILSMPLIAMVRSGNILNHPAFYTIAGAIAFTVLLLSGLRYVVKDGKLLIKIWIIPSGKHTISEIISVERSYNPISSPAASLKRLSIDSLGGYALISPVREQEFLETLKTINPSIKINVNNEKGWWRIWDWDV